VTYDHVIIYWLPSNGAIIQCGRKAHAIKAGRTSRVQQTTTSSHLNERALFHRNGKCLFSAPRHDRAIELILYSERPLKSYSLNAISELHVKLWHEHMGHLNWDALKKTQSTTSPPIVGIRFDESEPPPQSAKAVLPASPNVAHTSPLPPVQSQ